MPVDDGKKVQLTYICHRAHTCVMGSAVLQTTTNIVDGRVFVSLPSHTTR